MSISTASRVLKKVNSLNYHTVPSCSEGRLDNRSSSVTCGSMVSAAESQGKNIQNSCDGINVGISSSALTGDGTGSSREIEGSLSSGETEGLSSSSVIEAGTKLENEYLYKLKNCLYMLFTLGIAKSLVKKREARRVDESIEICLSFAAKLPLSLSGLKCSTGTDNKVELYRNVEKRYALVLDSQGDIFAYSLDEDLKQDKKATEDPMIRLDDDRGLARLRENAIKITDDFSKSNDHRLTVLNVLKSNENFLDFQVSNPNFLSLFKNFLLGVIFNEEFLNQIDLAVLNSIKFISYSHRKIIISEIDQSFTLEVDKNIRVGQLVCINDPANFKNTLYIDRDTLYAQKVSEDHDKDTYRLVKLKNSNLTLSELQYSGTYNNLFSGINLKLLVSKFDIFGVLRDGEFFEYGGDLSQITSGNCKFGDRDSGGSNIPSCFICQEGNPDNYIKVSCRGKASDIITQIETYLNQNSDNTLQGFLDQPVYVEDVSAVNNVLYVIRDIFMRGPDHRLATLQNMFPSNPKFSETLSSCIEKFSQEVREELMGYLLAEARGIFIEKYKTLSGIELPSSNLRKKIDITTSSE
ncbi:MAG: hypothetical protein QG673_217 [Pseudomonadota bacterium]|nr:hypothetical protein [Pseudomonadota bacterium]